MEHKVKDFPQYRRLFNGKSYYKITSSSEFVELQQVGEKWFCYQIKAAQYFEILRLNDMLETSDLYLEIPAQEYLTIEQQIAD
ncbi:hypothetical protein SAMN05216474_0232 [Lishizhenia tianjinensis]|uniref:Uncharacterized protein n=1 Tax=Lishizhenia tianjinensis TaxID=477690 RepID=A0A1I6XJB9_9FLAO|nr:hypothetical protein [Lishizhenia tianjinensis]SFT38131.1 hypothetical protein SAMN05216474_0232 [Lishizhenia tianjinensis]